MLETHSVMPAYAPLISHVVAGKLLGRNKHKEMIRGFYHAAEAYYADSSLKNRKDNIVDEISLGFFGHDGNSGTTGEFCIEWMQLGGKIHPRLCVFDDGWDALAHFSDLLAAMAKLDGTDPTPAQFCKLLKRLGIKDLTPRTR